MRRLFTLCTYIIGLYLFLLLHFIVLYILPPPWNSLNTVILASTIHIAAKPSHNQLLLAVSVAYAFMLDAFGGSIFGLLLISIPLAIYIVTILYYRIFTNRSWYSTAMLVAVGVVIFRTSYLILLYIFSFLFKSDIPHYQTLVTSFLWELIITMCTAAFVALFFSLYSSKFRTDNQVYWQS